MQATTRAQQSPPKNEVTKELVALRKEVERLSAEVHRLGGFIERGIETRRKGREPVSGEQKAVAEVDLITLSDEDVQRVQRDVEQRSNKVQAQAQRAPENQQNQQEERQPSKLRQGLHRTASPDPDIAHPTPVRHPRSTKCRTVPVNADGPGSPFPSIREEDETDFFDTSRRATIATSPSPSPILANHATTAQGQDDDGVPPQTVLSRVIAELESDFKHYKALVLPHLSLSALRS